MLTTNRGLKLAFITALISGISVFVNKFAVGIITPPLMFTLTKNIIVTIFLGALLFSIFKYDKFRNLTSSQLVKLVLIGLVGGSIPFYLFFTGLAQTSAINATMIHKSLVIWVALLAVLVLKERLSKTLSIAVLLMFSSNLLIGGFSGFEFSTGEFYILIATMFWTVETILVKKFLADLDYDILAFSRMGIGSTFLLLFGLFSGQFTLSSFTNLTPTSVGLLLVTSLFLCGYVLSWYYALKHSSAIVVSTVLVSATLITNILSAIFIEKSFSGLPLMSLVAIMAGLFLVLRDYKFRSSTTVSITTQN